MAAQRGPSPGGPCATRRAPLYGREPDRRCGPVAAVTAAAGYRRTAGRRNRAEEMVGPDAELRTLVPSLLRWRRRWRRGPGSRGGGETKPEDSGLSCQCPALRSGPGPGGPRQPSAANGAVRSAVPQRLRRLWLASSPPHLCALLPARPRACRDILSEGSRRIVGGITCGTVCLKNSIRVTESVLHFLE